MLTASGPMAKEGYSSSIAVLPKQAVRKIDHQSFVVRDFVRIPLLFPVFVLTRRDVA